MKFKEVPYHDDVKRRMRDMVDTGRLPHALLLEGSSGSGKFALAQAMAQYIHCSDRTVDGDSCGKCPSCLQHEKFNSIDTFFSFPVLKKSGKTTVSNDYFPEFRELIEESPFMDFSLWLSKLGNNNGQPTMYVEEISGLIDRMNLTARQARQKIVLIWLPERMREEAANKLLKLLEEPHSDTVFIMTSDAPSEILPTIYSRMQRVAVRRYNDAETAEILMSRFSVDEQSAMTAAALSEGNVNAALALVRAGSDTDLYLDLFINLMRNAWTRKVGVLRAWSNDVAALGREGAARFYEYCARMIRENFIMNLGESRLNAMSKAEQDFSVRFSPFINSANVLDIFKILTEARNDTLMNGNGKIIAFDLAVKMILLIKRATDKK